ncbi:MAG: ABC transporter permease [Bacteroidales bacterium]|nr:ABC transporter permease [Bacteroidales bacterium]
MIKNILLTTFRGFKNHKGFVAINLAGLGTGLLTAMLIALYVIDELSYDQFWPEADKVFRVENHINEQGTDEHWAATQGALSRELQARFPEIATAVRLHFNFMPVMLQHGEKTLLEQGIVFADSTFFDLFGLEIVAGNAATALLANDNIVLTRSLALKLFGNTNVVGKVITGEWGNLTVAAVVADVPANSHMRLSAIVPMSRIARRPGVNEFGPMSFYTYLKLKPGANPRHLQAAMNSRWMEVYGFVVDGDTLENPGSYSVNLALNPLTGIHLNGNAEKEIAVNGSRAVVYAFTGAALLVLLMACINYVNLTVARTLRRSRETGIRKVFGASARQIFTRYMAESLIMIVLAGAVALVVAVMMLPFFNQLTSKAIDSGAFLNPVFGLGFVVLALFMTLLSGGYPALVLSRIAPLAAIRASVVTTRGNRFVSWLRRSLIVVQFAISALLITGTITLIRQMRFIAHNDNGFQKENVLVMRTPSTRNTSYASLMEQELASKPQVTAVCGLSAVPGDRLPFLTCRLPRAADASRATGLQPDEQGNFGVRMLMAGPDFARVLGIRVSQGRSFSRLYPNDEKDAFVINHAAARAMGIDDTLGTPLQYTYALPQPKEGRVVGLVADFHFASLHQSVEPLIIHIDPRYFRYVAVRFNGTSKENALAVVQQAWDKVAPGVPFDYFFLDTFYNSLYQPEQNLTVLTGYFAGLAILIACMGMLGLVSVMVVQRTREFGIRKAIGAGIGHIFSQATREFLWLVLAANMLAVVPAWLLVQNWLETFAYRVDSGWWVFPAALLLSVVTMLVTITPVVLKSARANPVDALRYE